jgi:hypothetical protein
MTGLWNQQIVQTWGTALLCPYEDGVTGTTALTFRKKGTIQAPHSLEAR